MLAEEWINYWLKPPAGKLQLWITWAMLIANISKILKKYVKHVKNKKRKKKKTLVSFHADTETHLLIHLASMYTLATL